MKLILFRLILVFSGIFTFPGLLAQENMVDSLLCDGHCKCESDLSPVGVKFSHVHNRGEWMISYQWMNMNMHGLKSGVNTIAEQSALQSYVAVPTLMQMNMYMLMAMYGISDRLTIMTMLNYNTSYMEMKMPVGNKYHTHGMGTSGFGDAQLHLLYALLKNQKSQVFINSGINFPTGSISLKGENYAMMYPNQILPYSMQLGTGTYDLHLGINYLYEQSDVAMGVQLLSVLRPSYNSLGYKYGNELQFGGWLGWQWIKFVSSSLRLDLSNSGSMKVRNKPTIPLEDITADPANYGGRKMNIYIGSSFRFREGFLRKFRLRFEYGIPLYQNFNGVQMSVKNTMYADLSFSF